MSYLKVWIHIVFCTKNRFPYFATKETRKVVHKHIIENCNEKGILLLQVNGYVDHVHCLIALGKEQSISKVVKLVKGESSRWINKNNICENPFNWQDDYYAVSVGAEQLDSVVNYIKNQEKHHSSKSFEDEEKELTLK